MFVRTPVNPNRIFHKVTYRISSLYVGLDGSLIKKNAQMILILALVGILTKFLQIRIPQLRMQRARVINFLYVSLRESTGKLVSSD